MSSGHFSFRPVLLFGAWTQAIRPLAPFRATFRAIFLRFDNFGTARTAATFRLVCRRGAHFAGNQDGKLATVRNEMQIAVASCEFPAHSANRARRGGR